MILNESTTDYVSLMPLAKWLSKRFNLPLKRSDKAPKEAKAKHKKSNGSKDFSITSILKEMPKKTDSSFEQIPKSEGFTIGRIPKVKKVQEITESKPEASKNGQANEVEVDDLSSYSKVEALKKRATSNKAFVSTDAQENADITSEEWNQLKSLKSDTERMSHAMKKFGNKKPGEPNRNMSIHGYRRLVLAKKNEECQKLREENKANLISFEIRRKNIFQLKMGKIETIFTDQLEQDPLSKKRKAGEHEDMPDAKKPKLVKFKYYEEKMIEALVKYKKSKMVKSEDQWNTALINKYWRYYLRHFKNSMEETKTFYDYYAEYKDSDNNTVMTYDDLKKDRCAEMMFSQFAVNYGLNPVTRCKDCEETDKTMGREVMHPY